MTNVKISNFTSDNELTVSHNADDHDLGRLQVSGAPVPLLDDVADDDRIVSDRWGNPTFAAGKIDFARNGSLMYLSGRPLNRARTLIWTDRSGNTQPLSLMLNRYSHPRLSPDGKRLAIAAGSNIWVWPATWA